MRKQIRITNHKPDCQDHFHCIALNRRITVGKGKQKDKHHSSFCPSCDQYQKVDFTGSSYEYERIGDTNILKLTRKTKPRIFGNLDRQFTSEEIQKIRRRTGLTLDKPTTTKDIGFKERVKADPINYKIRTKEISNEASLKKQINVLEDFYKKVCRSLGMYDREKHHWYGAEKLGWDRKLVKRFLNTKTRPSIEALVRALLGPNLEFVVSAWPGQLKYKHIGWLQGGEDIMFFHRDDETWIKIAMADIKTRNEVMKAVIKKKARQRRKKKMLPYLIAVN